MESKIWHTWTHLRNKISLRYREQTCGCQGEEEWRREILGVLGLANINDYYCIGFPDSSAGKESAWNAGDPSSIPGLGRSAGEGTGCPLQYSWASLVAQLVKNPSAVQETWVWSLGWEDPLQKGKATHPSILVWIPWTVQSMGSQRVGDDWVTFTSLQNFVYRMDKQQGLPI